MEAERESRLARLALRPLLLVAGIYHLALGLAAMAAPRAFYDTAASFPPYNDHFLKDIGSFYVALAVVMVVAAGRRGWQAPVLAFTAIHYAAHTLSHLVDVGDSDPGWIGPATAAGIGALTAVFVWAAVVARRTGGGSAG